MQFELDDLTLWHEINPLHADVVDEVVMHASFITGKHAEEAIESQGEISGDVAQHLLDDTEEKI